MKYICALALLITAVSNAGTLDDILDSLEERIQRQDTEVISDVEVIELMRVETAEDLEAQLTDGYPMPWLEEILNDESIPEEDRYWLDCRMRAAIAQDLHLFFDWRGNPIHVEAEWIGPGEKYWREHMMVNPLGETDVPEENRPTRAFGEPGYIYNLYGDRVSEIAEAHPSVCLSRDASIAVVPSDRTTLGTVMESFACFMYPDGSFREIPFERRGNYEAVVSANGGVAAFTCTSPSGLHDPVTGERTGIVGDVCFYDQEGNLINSVSPPVLFSPGFAKISATGSCFCTRLSTGEIFLINCEDGFSTSLIGMSEGGRGRTSFGFSPDGEYLFAGGYSTGMVIELESGDTVWVDNNEFVGINDNVQVSCSNEARCIVSTIQRGDYPDYHYELELILNNTLVYTDTIERVYRNSSIMSPSGHFLLSYMEDPNVRDSYRQTVIRQIRGEEYNAQGN
ncbi:MAG: hypothetical protein JXR55_11830 [Candidatus Fermentibacteraceae bacterium]|nr:hypothetical protein [Candidatus Fermentibacteraceae bacterium]